VIEMALEISVASSLLKDLVYSLVMLLIFWVIHYPTWWLWFFHAGTWVAGLAYFISSDRDYYFSTIALAISLGVVGLDVFVLINTVCYFNGVKCCLNGEKYSPFTLTFDVCGANNRYDNIIVQWAAVSTLALGILVGIARTINMNNSRKSASIETALLGLYVGLKVYLLKWSGVSYTAYFWTQSILTMVVDGVAMIFSFKFRLVSTLLFAAVILVDMLVVLGATHSIGFFGSTAKSVVNAVKNPPAGGRHLLQQSSEAVASVLGAPIRDALTNAITKLQSVPVDATPSSARGVLDSGIGMLQSFALSVRQMCQMAHETEPGFACTDSLVSANSLLAVAEYTPCCDVNTPYVSIIQGIASQAANLNSRWDATWTVEQATYAGVAAVSAQHAQILMDAQSASLPASTNEWKSFGQSILDKIKEFWKSLVGHNVNQTQSPWVTATGEKVPSFVYYAWLSVHILLVGIAVFQLIGTLTRSHKLPGLFGAVKPLEAVEFGAREEDAHGVFGGISFGTARKRSKKPAASGLIEM